ncbi:MAG TPA: fumarate hydratase [Atribacteraceae bacterium]|nr:fumarate hydratase [Atribacteraceae bacterium]
MKEIAWNDLVSRVAGALREMNIVPTPVLQQEMERVYVQETGPGRDMTGQILENYREAGRTGFPLCQDTGMVSMDVCLGTEVKITGGALVWALDEGIRQAYQTGWFRNSILSDPLFGTNTGDNTPGIYTFEIVPGEVFRIKLLVKGGGCDNLSSLAMLEPGSGSEGVEEFLCRVIREKAGQACPPLVVGVGIGGSAASVMHIATRALSRPLRSRHTDDRYRYLEDRWKEVVNRTGIGPQGIGGKTTCLEVRVEAKPCHIASVPVGIVASCHVFRQRELEW